MSHRDPTDADFIGKRITAVDATCINIWRFEFDDGSKLAIEVESFGNGLMGMVVCDDCAEAMGGPEPEPEPAQPD